MDQTWFDSLDAEVTVAPGPRGCSLRPSAQGKQTGERDKKAGLE